LVSGENDAMARKKKDEPMPAAVEPKLKPVRLDLSPEEHKLLRIRAAEGEKSMSAFARMVLVDALKAMKPKGGSI
jgi:hypothetical protein